MAQRPSGWYDDPDSPDLLRYWDGVVWTEHVTSRRPTPPPSASRPAINEPAAGGSTQQWAEYQARQAFGERTGAPAGAGRSRGAGRLDDPTGASAAGRRGRGDGSVLAGWWRRVGAFYIDTLLVSLVCLPLTWSRYQAISIEMDGVLEAITKATVAGSAAQPQISPQLISDATFIGVVQTVVYILLEVFLLTRRGVTPGRFVTRIRVRRVGADERLDVATAARRTLVKNVSNLLGGVPLVSLLASAFQIVDFLWPLRDPGRQALHDKVASSEVV
ncbi:MAG: RDD family protein, partial [Micrococcales bacterium]|nr:RDD family protein [Micrococcales bacterium]